ncbi:aldo/keto reductase [Candidatus Latescibacterota bacterium]
MRRRDFIKTGTAGTFGLGLSGCSSLKYREIQLEPKLPPFSFGDNYPMPKGGTVPMGELGTTGIKISKFGFGSHMRPYLTPYVKERERMLREAFDFGVNIFDVYDVEHSIYQYEPTGKYLAPVINDVVISITIRPYDGRTLDEELNRDLKLFGKDCIDMVRIHAWAPDDPKFGHEWWIWDELFKYKEQGKIRAVGVPVHSLKDLQLPLEQYPLDFVIFPYNFYHNIAFGAAQAERATPDGGFDNLAVRLKEKGIGVVTMKPFAGDTLVTPFKNVAGMYNKEISYPQAALRYIINSGLNPDSTLAGMFYPFHVYENVDAYFKPEMSDDERKLLDKVKNVARLNAYNWLPEHYKFLENWASDSPGDVSLTGTV